MEAFKLFDKAGFFTVENVNNLLRLYVELTSKSTLCLLSLFCLSSVFVLHVTTSRYPSEYPVMLIHWRLIMKIPR